MKHIGYRRILEVGCAHLSYRMIRNYLSFLFLIPGYFPLLAAVQPQPGQEVDLADFGQSRSWNGDTGVEWDEARDVTRVELDLAGTQQIPSPEALQIQYWVGNWPPADNPKDSAGTLAIDSRWQGEWKAINADRTVTGKTLVYRFRPLTTGENPNARNLTRPPPSLRRTLKLRVHFTGPALPLSAFRVFGLSHWNVREVDLQTGCEGQKAFAANASAYNGRIIGSKSLTPDPADRRGAACSTDVRLKVFYTEHGPGSNDGTILTIRGGLYAFGVAVDDVIRRKAIYIKPLGVFLGDAVVGMEFARLTKFEGTHPGREIISRTSGHQEQTLRQAWAEIPPLTMTGHEGSHVYRHIIMGFPASREKYGLAFNGNVFISKRGSKAMKEDLVHMLWEEDEIHFRLGTGAIPDFREREYAARQDLLEGYLPLVNTHWENAEITYDEQAYATTLDSPLNDDQLRGDEPTILLMKVTARNSGSSSKTAMVWLHVKPIEALELRDGTLLGTGDQHRKYPVPRLRAAFEAHAGTLQLRKIPVESDYGGEAVLWTASAPRNSEAELYIKIPFRTFESCESCSDLKRVDAIHFQTRLEETMAHWRKAISVGTELHVPDEEFNRFYLAALQHILVSEERDRKTGLTMCPCATYDYAIFANETNIQVRMLDMRGLHDLAWRCLQPIVELQGSRPFPGRYQDTSSEFHGVRVDADHDYTMGGYNTDHGWTLWTLAEHYFFTRNREWLRSVMPRMLKGANFIIEERKASMQRKPDSSPVAEYGLLPPGDLEDVQDWQYWFAVNAYAYRGLNAAAEAIRDIDAKEGARLQQAAAAYRDDIRRTALEAMAITPVMPLRDGTFTPTVPPHTSLHGRALGWDRNTLYGSLTLVDCGVFDPEEPVATWILQDYENNLLMDDLSVPGAPWFSRGGLTFQPNLLGIIEDYLRRDQVPEALRIFYNTFATSYYHDVAVFTEGLGSFGFGQSGGAFLKTSDEAAFLTNLRLLLVREAADRLYLNSGAPREWFRPGRTIEIEHAATFFGDVSFRIDSHPEQGFIDARVSTPRRNRPREILLRLRHPEDKRIVRLEMNGHPWSQYDPETEIIRLPVNEPEITLRAFF